MPTLRRYEPNDKKAVIEIWQPTFASAHAFLSDGFMRHEKVNFGALFLPHCEGFCYTDHDRIIAFIGFIDNDIGMMFVDANHQRQGLGLNLLIKALEAIKHAGFDSAQLDVFEKNKPALQMYLAAGFRQLERFMHEPTRQWIRHLNLDLNESALVLTRPNL